MDIILNYTTDVDKYVDIIYDVYKENKNNDKIKTVLLLLLKTRSSEGICKKLINKYCITNDMDLLKFIYTDYVNIYYTSSYDNVIYENTINICFKYYYYNYYKFILSKSNVEWYILQDDCFIRSARSGFLKVFKELLCELYSDGIIIKAFTIAQNRYIKKLLYERYIKDFELVNILLDTLTNKNDIIYIKSIRIYSKQYSDINIVCI